jgi:hypothetical protein
MKKTNWEENQRLNEYICTYKHTMEVLTALNPYSWPILLTRVMLRVQHINSWPCFRSVTFGEAHWLRWFEHDHCREAWLEKRRWSALPHTLDLDILINVCWRFFLGPAHFLTTFLPQKPPFSSGTCLYPGLTKRVLTSFCRAGKRLWSPWRS